MDKPVTVRWQDIPSFGTSDERLLDKGWHVALIGGTHRDCSALDHANALTLEEMLDEVDPDQEHWGGMHCGHWAVGWYNHLVVDPTYEPVMRVLKQAYNSLQDYPVLSEDKLSEVELDWHCDGKCDEHCPFDHCANPRCRNPIGEHARGKRCMECREEG